MNGWKVKDRNGLSHKVAGLPQTRSGQQRQNLLGVLPDQHQQGQTLGQFTGQATIELPDGCAFFKGFTQIASSAKPDQLRLHSRWVVMHISFRWAKKNHLDGWLVVVRD
jgi:hypothetical protein